MNDQRAKPAFEEELIVVVSQVLSMHGNTSEACDLREWSERQLVAAAKIGRSAPFGELCKRHQKRVFAVVQRMMRNREDAEDAVQDRLLNAFTHMKDFDERSLFSTWLIRIAINAALARLRKKRRIREVPVNEPDSFPELGVHREIQDAAPDPEQAYHLHERKKILNTAIAGLRPRARDVVEIYELQEHSVKKKRRDFGDLDHRGKNTHVPRKSRPTSNAVAAEYHRVQSDKRGVEEANQWQQ
jgi:RNA polymerase sigma-70 factor (ECF subfamily)